MTTFFAMVYILMVNANMFADPFGDGQEIKGSSWVIAALFVAALLLTH